MSRDLPIIPPHHMRTLIITALSLTTSAFKRVSLLTCLLFPLED